MSRNDKCSTRFRFGEFEVDTARFELSHLGEPVAVEPQVFSLLVYLITHRDRVVGKDELLDELWGHRFVTESALTTRIKSLRKAVGDSGRDQQVVKTVYGKGYRFVAELQSDDVTRQRTSAPPRLGNLGNQRTPLFGRERDLERCEEALRRFRLVSLLGIGGTGKTALAKAVGRRLGDRYPDGVWFVDLVPVTDAPGIDFAIATTLDLGLDAGPPREQLVRHLAEREVLLILDNCEHIEDDVAAAVDHLLEFTRLPRFLITSRDPIDLPDEHRLFIDPLAANSDSGDSPALQLFLSTATLHGVTDVAGEREALNRICVQLDGLPLAIELAAAQLRYFTLHELVERLDQRFELLAGRTRVGSRRQESLRAVLDATWQLLNEPERNLIAQLAAFPGEFTMDDADALLDPPQGVDTPFAMSRFVELCLLSRTSVTGARWRLLTTVRMYALSQVSDEVRLTNARRHATWCLVQVGEDVHRHRHNFAAARWVIAHYDDIVLSQDFFSAAGDNAALVAVCSALVLTIQLDEGVRARAQLPRIERYLNEIEDALLRSRLHAVAAVCGQVLSAPDTLSRHAEAGLDAARQAGDAQEIAGQLILVSVRTSFIDPPLAVKQLEEALTLARTSNAPVLVDAANCFLAWHLTMRGQYEEGRKLALDIVERNFATRFDNLTFNAVCAVIACSLQDDPERAAVWTERLMATADAQLLWSAQLLMACAYAVTGKIPACVDLLIEVHRRLDQAGWDGLPDLLVPAALLAHARGESAMATTFIESMKVVDQPLQTFHVIAVYRQVRDAIPSDPSLALTSREEVGGALEAFLQV